MAPQRVRMEVGRVGDLRVPDGSTVRLRWSAIDCMRLAEQKPFYEGKTEVNCASRWSAVGCMRGTTKKNGLTRAGLLMEVARDPLGELHGTGLLAHRHPHSMCA